VNVSLGELTYSKEGFLIKLKLCSWLSLAILGSIKPFSSSLLIVYRFCKGFSSDFCLGGLFPNIESWPFLFKARFEIEGGTTTFELHLREGQIDEIRFICCSLNLERCLWK
jgi:hypothetical protein